MGWRSILYNVLAVMYAHSWVSAQVEPLNLRQGQTLPGQHRGPPHDSRCCGRVPIPSPASGANGRG